MTHHRVFEVGLGRIFCQAAQIGSCEHQEITTIAQTCGMRLCGYCRRLVEGLTEVHCAALWTNRNTTCAHIQKTQGGERKATILLQFATNVVLDACVHDQGHNQAV